MILSGDFGRMLTYACGNIRSIPLSDTIGRSKELDTAKLTAVNG